MKGKSNKTRKLTLHRETLRVLTAEDLAHVVGGTDGKPRPPNSKSECKSIVKTQCKPIVLGTTDGRIDEHHAKQ